MSVCSGLIHQNVLFKSMQFIVYYLYLDGIAQEISTLKCFSVKERIKIMSRKDKSGWTIISRESSRKAWKT